MKNRLEIGSIVLVGCSLLALASFFVARVIGPPRGTDAEGSMTIERPTRSFGTAPEGSTFYLSYKLSNPTSDPILIMGLTPYCGLTGCAEALGLPTSIEPHQAHELLIEVKAGKPGDFDRELTLYTDRSGTSGVPLIIKGRVVAASEELAIISPTPRP